MHIIVCLDDQNGIQFNHRRQSRDRAVIADMVEQWGKITVHPKSASLFESIPVTIAEDFTQASGACFAEDPALLPAWERIESVTVYRWNRVYPADVHFILPENWQCTEKVDFVGNSHETITKEVYKR